MSRLPDLIAQAKAKGPQLGADLDQEFKQLSSRLPFGLNFERHRPEAVELPRRPIRKGDKVHVLPPEVRRRRATRGWGRSGPSARPVPARWRTWSFMAGRVSSSASEADTAARLRWVVAFT